MTAPTLPVEKQVAEHLVWRLMTESEDTVVRIPTRGQAKGALLHAITQTQRVIGRLPPLSGPSLDSEFVFTFFPNATTCLTNFFLISLSICIFEQNYTPCKMLTESPVI